MKRFLAIIKEDWQDKVKRILSLVELIFELLLIIVPIFLRLFDIIDFRLVVFAEFVLILVLLIKYFSLKQKSIRFDDLYIDNVPMISTLSYIMNARKRSHYNNFDVLNVDIRYKFDHVPNSETAVMQTVTWDFHIQNKSKKAITSMMMMVSKSVFSKYANIELSAKNTETGGVLDINPTEIIGAQRYVEIMFDEKGIIPDESLHFQLKMQWTKPYHFTEKEFLIVDPMNYSLKTHIVNTIFETDCTFLAEVPVRYFSVSRNSLANRVCKYNKKFECRNNAYGFSQSFKPEKNKLYLLKIEYDPSKNTADHKKTLVGSAH